MPIPTEVLAERIQETNQRLVESNERLSDEIHELGRKFDDFRVEMAERLGAINANLEGFRGRTEASFKVAVWGITLAIGAAVGIVGSAITGAWYAAKLDSRLEQVETRLGPLPTVHAPKVP